MTIDSSGLPRTQAYVVCKPSDLDRAIAALLDNAIKYSFMKKVVYVAGSVEGTRARITFENYGIGIPPEKLRAIGKRTVRADIPDPMRYRTGTGLGLAIARYVFEDLLDGELAIESDRPPEVTGDTLAYHRYVTKVTVTLPIHTLEPK